MTGERLPMACLLRYGVRRRPARGRILSRARTRYQARLRLFLKICETVAYAHRNLVIHRDLKPANIFVTAAGAPKLLDFGIARLVTADRGDTLTGFRAFTPDYASPEQMRGERVSTATDVYSLGALLRVLVAPFGIGISPTS